MELTGKGRNTSMLKNIIFSQRDVGIYWNKLVKYTVKSITLKTRNYHKDNRTHMIQCLGL